jgi:hypothetical protein
MTAALSRLAYDPNNVKPGGGALLLVLGLAVVTYLLWRSMNTQLGKISMPPRERPSRFAPGPDDGEDDDERRRAPIDDDTQRPPDAPG